METASILQLLGSAEKDAKWLNNNYSKLLENYPDQFVAIHDGNFIDASKNFDDLISKIENKRFNPSNVLIEFISKIKKIL